MDTQQLTVTVQDIFDAIPQKVRIRALVTVDRIYNSDYLQFMDDEEIEDE